MATATKEPAYASLHDHHIAALSILARDAKNREMIDLDGPVDFTFHVCGVILRGRPQTYTRKQVDWERLVRCLLVEMSHEQKQAAARRLIDPKRSKLETNLDKWIETITTKIEGERAGPLNGKLEVELIDPEPMTVIETLAIEER